MVRRDPVGIRLLTRNGHDWSSRYPRIVEAVNLLRVRSLLVDGEAVCCGSDGLPAFEKLRGRRHDHQVFLFAFDLLELNGTDLRPEPPISNSRILLPQGNLPRSKFYLQIVF